MDHQTHTPPESAPAPGKNDAAEERHQQDALDEALEETFPSSDPIAVSVAPEPPKPR